MDETATPFCPIESHTWVGKGAHRVQIVGQNDKRSATTFVNSIVGKTGPGNA